MFDNQTWTPARMPGEATRHDEMVGTDGLAILLAAALDELDYGILLVDAGQRIVYVNQSARRSALDVLCLDQRRVQTKRPEDSSRFRAALNDAAQRGLRRLLALGGTRGSVHVAVIPLPRIEHASGPVTALVFSRRGLCEVLSMTDYARNHALTPTERRVLAELCEGARPDAIAARLGIALSTVRTHIGAIRGKTNAATIGDLVRGVATLPPLMPLLREPARLPS